MSVVATDYIKLIGDHSIQVIAHLVVNIKIIQDLGGASGPETNMWRIDYHSEDQLAKILQRLRDADLAFAGGSSGWPATAVAQMLRDRGKFHGVITGLFWEGPNKVITQQL